MDINELFEKNKNSILNLGIVILALFIAFQIYGSTAKKINLLVQQKENELMKNEASEEIVAFMKKIDRYKKVFVKRDLGNVMDAMSLIAKQCAVKVSAIKPDYEMAAADYIKSSFEITINAPDYHALGNFISQIESYQDIYFVDVVKIIRADTGRFAEVVDTSLNVNLKISTISYL